MSNKCIDSDGIIHTLLAGGEILCQVGVNRLRIANAADSTLAVTCLECMARECPHIRVLWDEGKKDTYCIDCGADLYERIVSYNVHSS